MHIELDDELVSRIDEVAGKRGRSAFVRKALERELDQARRNALILSAIGSISATGHDWDPDPAAWVRRQRESDPRRSG